MSHLMRGFASYAKGVVRNSIKSNRLAMSQLNMITILNKGNSKPLVDTGDFANSVSSRMVRRLREGVIGIDIKPKSGIHTPSGLSYERLWNIMIKGATWTPSEKQRLWMKIRLKELGLSDPGAQRKLVWNIPGRPFLEKSLGRVEVHDRFHDMCDEALNRSLKELGWRST
jgi:hypothetical protein